MSSSDPKSLRRNCLAKRRRLTAEQIAATSLAITSRFWRLPPAQRGRKIGVYCAVNGEVDCEYITAEAWTRGRRVYLPVIQGRELRFARYEKSTHFSRNRYGIPEPEHKKSELIRPAELDIVIVPLVAFDKRGNRIGMGAGYYDRSFRVLKNRRAWRRPKFVGVGYDFQKTASIKAFSWDVGLHFALTETRSFRF